MAGDFRIEGLQKTIKKMDKLDRAFGGKGEALQGVVIRAAKVTQSNVRAEAPYRTGALRRGILAEERKKIKNMPSAEVRANYSRSKGPIAPHAHLVERGHVTASGSHTPANPFFRRGVERSKRAVRRMIEKEMSALIKRATRR